MQLLDRRGVARPRYAGDLTERKRVLATAADGGGNSIDP